MNKVRSIALAIFMGVQLGQFIDYNQFYRNAHDGQKWKDGTYFVLVSADWCSPCQGLKTRLRVEFPNTTVALVDFDTEQVKEQLMNGSDGKLPCLIRYDIKDGKSIRRYWNRSEDLRSFLANDSDTQSNKR